MATDIKKMSPIEMLELLKGDNNSKVSETNKQNYEQVFEFMKGSNISDFTSKLDNFFDSNITMLSLNQTAKTQDVGAKKSVQQYSAQGNNIDEKIGDSAQGNAADCWLLATLNSLSYSAEGQKIIKDAIKDNGNGTRTVDLKGIGKGITVSDKELAEARKSGKYSSGDDDMLLMEIAFEKAMDKIKSGEIKTNSYIQGQAKDGDRSIDWGYSYDAMFLLTGKGTESVYYNRDHWSHDDKPWYSKEKIQRALPWLADFCGNGLESVYDKLEKNPGGYCATIAFQGNKKEGEPVTVKDVNGKSVTLSTGNGGHMWSIKSVKGDKVTIVNPWDSSKEITVSKKEIAKYVTGIETYKYN